MAGKHGVQLSSGKNSRAADREGPDDAKRREVLKKIGKHAVYTAPAMMVLLMPKKGRGVMLSGGGGGDRVF